MTIKPLARAHAALQALARPQAHPAGPKARIENSGNAATVHIYDEIGGYGVLASELVPELKALDVAEVEVRLNSPGGDYFDGVAIANALAELPGRVVVHVDGLAASAASVIAMAGDEIVMHPGSRMMIHDALTLTVGNARDHETARDLLDAVSADIAEVYAAKAGGYAAEWRDAMRAESWYGASDAVTAGLATSAVSRETSPEPAQGDWRELVAVWRDRTPSATAEVAPPAEAPPVAAVLPLSELCSAYREVIA